MLIVFAAACMLMNGKQIGNSNAWLIVCVAWYIMQQLKLTKRAGDADLDADENLQQQDFGK